MSSSAGAQGKSPCSTMNLPLPQTVTCLHCGEETEIWTDEPSADCPSCKQRIIPRA